MWHGQSVDESTGGPNFVPLKEAALTRCWFWRPVLAHRVKLSL